jgi:hypothetical protein
MILIALNPRPNIGGLRLHLHLRHLPIPNGLINLMFNLTIEHLGIIHPIGINLLPKLFNKPLMTGNLLLGHRLMQLPNFSQPLFLLLKGARLEQLILLLDLLMQGLTIENSAQLTVLLFITLLFLLDLLSEFLQSLLQFLFPLDLLLLFDELVLLGFGLEHLFEFLLLGLEPFLSAFLDELALFADGLNEGHAL